MKKLLILLVLAGVVFLAWFLIMLRPAGSLSSESSVVAIGRGTSVASIATTLKERGVIRSPFAFKAMARLQGTHKRLQAGTYIFSPSQSVGEILDVLAGGKTEDISVTIPEGYTVAQIDALLVTKGIGKAGEFVDCAFDCVFEGINFLPAKNTATRKQGYGSKVEGYLFPDTYFVSPTNYTPQAFIERLLQTFRARIVDKYQKEIGASGKKLGEIVTMASLLEEESRPNGDEREIVSGILWKREDAGTLLGVDATVRYILSKPKEALTNADLDTQSPYNTRKVRGLPPGPIANPGESAIRAAMLPTSSQYWYYLHDNNGEIHYARTNDEHNENRARYLH